VSGEAILSAENSGKHMDGRAQTPAGGAHSAPPDHLAGVKRIAAPSLRTPPWHTIARGAANADVTGTTDRPLTLNNKINCGNDAVVLDHPQYLRIYIANRRCRLLLIVNCARLRGY